MFVLALSLYNTWNRGVFLLCKITNLLIYSIVLKNLDGSTRLYLEYVKNNGNMAEFQVVSEIEIYGLKNGHADDPVYEGEKVMAEQYEEITEYLKKYGF